LRLDIDDKHLSLISHPKRNPEASRLGDPPYPRAGILPATIDPVGVFRNGPYITNLRITREVVRFRSPSAAHWVEFMKAHFGPTINAFQHSSPDAQKQLTKEMTGLIQEFNRSPNSTILSNSEYLGVVATRG